MLKTIMIIQGVVKDVSFLNGLASSLLDTCQGLRQCPTRQDLAQVDTVFRGASHVVDR